MITNTTIYNREMINEIMKVMSKPIKIYAAILTSVIFLVSLIQLFYSGIGVGFRMLFASIVISALIWSALNFRIKNIEKENIDKLFTVSHSDIYEMKIVVEEEFIDVDSENATHKLFHRDLRCVNETERYIVLSYIGKTYIILDKRGFSENDANLFRQIIRDYI